MSDQFFVLHIDPPQLCHHQECTRLTSIAEAEHESEPYQKQLRVSPGCWEHGYSEADETGSVARYVVGYYAEKEGKPGTAVVLGPCPLDSIPAPYEMEVAPDDPEEADFWQRHHSPDLAWYVQFTDSQGAVTRLAVVFYVDYLQFDLFPFPPA